ncbi:hypothetical protein [Holospora obtusa]|nr:hypothetical protein [Holospora obtusa]
MHRVMPMEIRSLFTLHKIRTMIWKVSDHLVKTDAVLSDKAVRC